MKKVFAIVFAGGLLMTACTKKPDHSMQDSNTMLEEPETQMVPAADSAVKDSAPAVMAPVAKDSAAVK